MEICQVSAEQRLFFEQRLLRASKAARFLGVSSGTLRRLTRTGQLRAVRTPGKEIRWRVADLMTAVEDYKQERDNA